MMNPEAQEVLNKILNKEPKNLTEEEIGFLRARRSYLKEAQVKEFASVLETKLPKRETVKQNANK